MTPYARRARDRRRKAARHKWAGVFAGRLMHRINEDNKLSDEEYLERVRERLRQMQWSQPRKALGVKPHG